MNKTIRFLLRHAIPLAAVLSLGAVASAEGDFTRMAVIDIIKNPPAGGTKVSTYGTVEQNERARGGAASVYFLKGDEGGVIEVQTNAGTPPIPATRYDNLQGIVQFKLGADGSPTPYLMEVPAVVTPPPPPPPAWEKYLPHLLMLVAVVVLGVFVLLFLRMRQPERAPIILPPDSVTDGDKTVKVSDDEITIRRDQTTVRLNNDITRVYFNGHLVIRSGGEAGSKIPLCCSATGGKRMTIGRRSNSPAGDSFIGLDDPTRALSRNQAVFAKAGDRVIIENQQAANPTTVDGRSLSPGESVTLRPGMTIGFPPEYVFEFRDGPHHQA